MGNDLKVYLIFRSTADRQVLQHDRDGLIRWSNFWLLPVNLAECAYTYVGRSQYLDWGSSCIIRGAQIQATMCGKNLAVFVSSTMKTRKNTEQWCASAWDVHGSICRPFSGLSLEVLCPSHVGSSLEYDGSASFICPGGEAIKLEGVPRGHSTYSCSTTWMQLWASSSGDRTVSSERPKD